MTKQYTGIVNWFDSKKGFGTINLDEGHDLIVNDVFVHHSDINIKNCRANLNENECVKFEVEEVIKNNSRKWNAKNVQAVNGSLICENSSTHKKHHKRIKNTESFDPNFEIPDMTIRIGNNIEYSHKINTRDIILVKDFFPEKEPLEIYNQLLKEIDNSDVKQEELWKLWHGDTHMIADDHLKWKQFCPTFTMIIDKIKQYFNMDIKATRFNLYRDSSEWKPFHHDAAAVKSDKAKSQNFTVGISFGCERDVCFEHAKNKNKISFPLENGTLYAFSKDINVEWRHGIPQIHPDKFHKDGRLSIIAWGKVDMNE